MTSGSAKIVPVLVPVGLNSKQLLLAVATFRFLLTDSSIVIGDLSPVQRSPVLNVNANISQVDINVDTILVA